MRRAIVDSVGPLLWLVFLLASLTLPVIYLLGDRHPIGDGAARLALKGALAGSVIGGTVLALAWPALRPVGWWSGVKHIGGSILLGAFGGVGAAGLLNEQRVVSHRDVELPLARMETGSRRAYAVTLAPTNPPRLDRVQVARIGSGQISAGMCLFGTVQEGWLGGAWVRAYRADRCTAERGTPDSHVVASPTDHTRWRWHAPQQLRAQSATRRTDDALPSGLECRTQQGSWLLLCPP